jgi:hypothetical protein
MARGDDIGATPQSMTAEEITGRIFIPQGFMRQPPSGGGDSGGSLKLWHLLLSIIGGAFVIVAGIWSLSQQLFVDRKSYHEDQKVQIHVNESLKGAVSGVSATTADLKRSVERLNEALGKLNITENNGPRRRP